MVSILNANSKHMKTLNDPNNKTGTGAIDALRSHNLSNIKNQNIYI